MFLNTPPNSVQSKTQCVSRHRMSRSITTRTEPMLASKPPDRFLTITCTSFCHGNTSRHNCVSSSCGFQQYISSHCSLFHAYSSTHVWTFLYSNFTTTAPYFNLKSSRSGMTARVVQKIGWTFRGLSTLQNCGRNRSGRERSSCRQP